MTAPPPTPLRQVFDQARFDAAVELVRAGDELRQLGHAGRPITVADRQRYHTAEQRWLRLRGVA